MPDDAEGIEVRAATPGDAARWLELRTALWPESGAAEHRAEIDLYFARRFPRDPWAVLLAEGANHVVLGFAELSTRPYAEGCLSHPVAYLEGWFVSEDARGRGAGRALIAAAERWGREQGCTELASDADPGNHASVAAHGAVGFTDAGLVRCFRKRL